MALSTTAWQPVFLGFLAKKVTARPAWLHAPAVVEIASVSGCIAEEAPKDFGKDGWRWNAAGVYSTEALALEAKAAAAAPETWILFAYRIFPVLYGEHGASALDIHTICRDLPPEPPLSAYQHVGYDLVEAAIADHGLTLGCSPLSCNGCAAEHPVNRWCLIDDLGQAMVLGQIFGDSERSGVEPGPYCLVEVLRRG